MKNIPLVSIVTPSYNQGRFIEDTILSVKNQDYSNIEHIIVDGGSTDNTIEVLKKYEGTYNMRWISEPDEGQADAVNKGFEMARGEIIGWLNSDDIYTNRNSLSSVVDCFLMNPETDIVYGNAVHIDGGNYIRRVRILPKFNFQQLLRFCYIVQPSVFFRKHVITQNKLNIHSESALDYELWLRLGKEYKFYHINKILSADRNHIWRKIIYKKNESNEESIQHQKDFGQKFGLRFNLFRIADKIQAGYFRVKGLKCLFDLRKEGNFSVNLKFNDNYKMIKDQLYGDFKKLL